MKKKAVVIILVMVILIAGINVPSLQTEASSGWTKDANGCYFTKKDGTYPASSWLKISGRWYYFDRVGYIYTGWTRVKGKWYYLDEKGSMARSKWIGNNFVNKSGEWIKYKSHGKVYRVSAGAKKTPAKKVNRTARKYTGWNKLRGKWYYFKSNGTPCRGWVKTSDKWYGVTYREDKEDVTAALQAMKDHGGYPPRLWADAGDEKQRGIVE